MIVFPVLIPGQNFLFPGTGREITKCHGREGTGNLRCVFPGITGNGNSRSPLVRFKSQAFFGSTRLWDWINIYPQLFQSFTWASTSAMPVTEDHFNSINVCMKACITYQISDKWYKLMQYHAMQYQTIYYEIPYICHVNIFSNVFSKGWCCWDRWNPKNYCIFEF